MGNIYKHRINQINKMFSRSFMREFPLRKYARVSAPYGTICNDAFMMGSRDLIPKRIGVVALTTLFCVMAYTSFDVFYEMIHHVPGPGYKALYLNDVPDSVKIPNE